MPPYASSSAGLGQGLLAGFQGYQQARKLASDEKARKAQAEKQAQTEAQALERQGRTDELDSRYKEAQIAKLLFESKGGGKGAVPGGLKLKPGERYNPQTDTVEPVPGSALYQEQAGKHGKDLAGVVSVKQKAGGGIEAIDNFLNTKGAVESQFGGGYSGLVTSRMNPDARANLENIKAAVRSAGLDMMRAGGSVGTMTEREWPMVEQLMANITNSMSEEEARLQLAKAKAKMESIQNEAARLYQLEWGNTPYSQQMRTTPGGAPPAGDGKRYKILSVE